MNDNELREALKDWRKIVNKYQKTDKKLAIGQIFNSFLPFIGILVLMYFSLEWSYLITLGLGVINAFFLVRIFIIQHDCGHQSFFSSRKINNVIGFISSLFSTIPYQFWSRNHSAHHAHSGQLEHRGLGDIYYLTTEEYQMRSWRGKIIYRIFRTPIVQFIFIPIYYFTINLRFPYKNLKGWKRIRMSYYLNNILIIATYTGLALWVGFFKLMLIHIPILLLFGIIAFWFFYIQHQHEENYKEWKDNWDHLLASIQGSTYYKLPRLFQWLTGNIGYHHIHHLNSRIPNYHLSRCAHENPQLNTYANVLSFKDSLKCMSNKLWDENSRKMISFKEYRRLSK